VLVKSNSYITYGELLSDPRHLKVKGFATQHVPYTWLHLGTVADVTVSKPSIASNEMVRLPSNANFELLILVPSSNDDIKAPLQQTN